MHFLKWSDRSLTVKIVLYMLILVLVIVFLITALSVNLERQAFQEELEQQAFTTLDMLVASGADALYFFDVSRLINVIGKVPYGQTFVQIRYYNPSGRVLVSASESGMEHGQESDPLGLRLIDSDETLIEWQAEQLLVGQRVVVGNDILGAVSLGLSTQPLEKKIADLRMQGIFIALLIASLGLFPAIWFSRSLTLQLRKLVVVTERIAEGDLSVSIDVQGKDEIGLLSAAIQDMTGQLQELINSLERRVADRTRALETSSEISRQLSTILDQDQLVREVVEQLRSAFGYYHAHIYLFDEDRQILNMAGGTGDVGRSMLARGHKLAKGQGLVGRCAESNRVVLIPDVSQAAGWLPNPLLPETKAELAVPIAFGRDVLGVLGVQHNITEGLAQQDADLVQVVANQVAVAVLNARIYGEMQRQTDRDALAASINQRIQSATSVDEVLKLAVRELSRSLGARRSKVELRSSALLDERQN